MKTAKRIGSLVLALLMMLSLFPTAAFAEGAIAPAEDGVLDDPVILSDDPASPERGGAGQSEAEGSEELSLDNSVILSEAKDLSGDSSSAEPPQNDRAGEPEAHGVPQMEEAAPITTAGLRSYTFTSAPENGFTIPTNGSYIIHWATNFSPVKQVIKKMQYAASIVNPNDPPVLIWDSTLVELSGGVSSYPIAWDPDFIDDASSTGGCCYELWAYYSDSEYIVSRFVGISEKPVFIQEPAGGFTIPANGTHRINWSTNFAQTGFKLVYSVYTMSITDGSPFLWDQKTVAESSSSQTWYDLHWDAGFSGHDAGIYTLYVYYSNGTSGRSIQIDFPGCSEARAFTQTPPARFDIPVNGSYTINWDTSFQCNKYVLQVDTYIVPFDGGSPIHSGETETVAVMPGTQKSYTFDWIHPDQTGQGTFVYNEYTLLAYDSSFVERVYFRINFERPAFTRAPSSAVMTKLIPANLNWETNFDIQRVTLYSVYYNGTYDYIFIRSLPAGTTSCEISYHDIQDAYLQGYDKIAIRAFYGSEDSEYVQHDLDISIKNTQGYCGIDNGSYQIWSFDESTGTLTISGTGQMADFTDANVPWATFRSQIQTVNIEEGVSGVGEYAFYNCPKLTTVNLPYSLTSIGDYAFDNCPALADATINMSQQLFNTTVSWDKTKNAGLRDAAKHFTFIAGGQAGPDLTWKLDNDGILSFSGSGAMYDWSISEPAPWYAYRSSITTLRLANVTTVGDCAFRGCSKLTAVSFPPDLTYLGVRAFGSCSGLTTVYWAAPSSMNLTEIREACFSGTGLQSFTVPRKCAVIGQGAFSGCDALTTVSFPEGSALTTVGNRAFYSCDNLANIPLPEGVTSLGEEAFYNCRSLTSFPLPSTLTSLGKSCFSGCSGVTGIVTIPAGVEEISERCFLGCSGFYKLVMSPSTNQIGPYAFSGCSKLTDVEYDGFRVQWEQETTLDSSGNAALINARFTWLFRTGTLSGDGVHWSLYGSSGRLEIWGSGATPNWPGTPQAAPWYLYRDYIQVIDVHAGVTQIGAYAFANCASLTTVYLPDSLKRIAGAAFFEDRDLADVWYSGSELDREAKLSIDTPNYPLESARWHYTGIGGSVLDSDGHAVDLSWSFDQDSGILRVYWDEDSMDQNYMEIPDYRDGQDTPWYQYNHGQLIPLITAVHVDELVTRIGDYAFAGLSEVTDVQIASTVTSIGEGAFKGCINLIEIHLPDTVETLGDNLFWGCGSLYTVSLPAGLTEVPSGAFYGCDDLYKAYLPGSVERIRQNAFYRCTSLTDIYFGGTSAQWAAIELYSGNDPVNSARIHFTPPEIAVDEVNFPDPAFRNYVRENFDDDRSGWLTDEERLDTVSIYCANLGIESLTGIGYFPNVPYLDASGNELSESLDLTGNPKLVYVNLSGNQLNSLDLTDLTALRTLIFSGNDTGWGAPDLSTNIALEYLDCSGCDGMEDLDLSANTALTDLICGWNQLDALDLSANTALQRLDCSHNNLTSLDLSANTDLRQADCIANVLTTLTLGQQANLITLSCYANELTALDLTGCPKLRTTVITGTRAEKTNLNWYDYPYVEYSKGANWVQVDSSTALILGHYVLSGFEASATGMSYYDSVGGYWLDGRVQTPVWKNGNAPDFTAVSSYNITVCLNEACTEKVTTEPAPGQTCYVRYSIFLSDLGKGNVDFSELSTANCTLNLAGYSSECISVKTVASGGKDAGVVLFKVVKDAPDGIPIDEEHFPDAVFRAWVAENCDPDGNGYLTDAERAAVVEIQLCSSDAASLEGIAWFEDLESLELNNNDYLTSLDLRGNTALKGVYVYYNGELSSLNLSGLTQLKDLEAEYNSLASLDLSTNTALQSLDCSGNGLTELDVCHCPELRSLSCYENSLTTLDVSMLTKLEGLYCNDNQLAELDLQANTALTELDCSSNQLTEIDLSVVPLLRGLWIIGNGLTELDVSMLPELRVLECYDMPLESLKLGTLENLSRLACYETPESFVLDISGCPLILDAYQNGTKTTTDIPGVLSFDTYKSGSHVLEVDPDQKIITVPMLVTAKAASLNLDGTIGLNFKVVFSDSVLESGNAEAVFLYKEQETRKPIAGMSPDSNGYYVFTFRIPAPEFANTVQLKFMAGDTVIPFYNSAGRLENDTLSYSGQRYSEVLPAGNRARALIDALHSYCHYAYYGLEYGEPNVAPDPKATTPDISSVTAASVEPYKNVVTGSVTGLSANAISLMLESATEINIKFKLQSGHSISEYSFKLDGKTVTPVYKGGLYIVTVRDIAAKDLDTRHTLVVTAGEEQLTISTCALSYCYSVLANNLLTTEMQNTCKALYLYNQAANAYFGS